MLDDMDLAVSEVFKYGHGKRDHLVKFSTAGRVFTFLLLGWITFY